MARSVIRGKQIPVSEMQRFDVFIDDESGAWFFATDIRNEGRVAVTGLMGHPDVAVDKWREVTLPMDENEIVELTERGAVFFDRNEQIITGGQ